MSKEIISLLLALLPTLSLMAQGGSGQGYDPTNPPDPQANYSLTVKSSPENGGYLNYEGTFMVQVGEELYIEASPRTGYEFESWRIGEEIVSLYPSFNFTMPASNVVLTAWFNFVGTGSYNPSNPGDPFVEGYRHNVRVYSSPSVAGWINPDNFYMTEGEEGTLYAYPNNSFKFSCWKQNGKIISVSPELPIKMGNKDLEFTAQFVYNPTDPGDPFTNSWNEATGELVMDHFEAGNLWGSIGEFVGWDNFDKIVSLTVIGEIGSGDFGVVGYMPGIVEADFSRTSGGTDVYWSCFSNLQSLTRVMLPSSVSHIQNYAFSECPSLSEISVYAMMPPEVENETFNGLQSGLVIKVYSGSIDLYESADVWKDFTIRPLDEETVSYTVFLPDDYTDGRYKNAVLQLSNLSSGQTNRLVVSEKRNKYIFGNLIPDLKYSLYALAPNGYVIGKNIDFVIPKEGDEYKFESLLPLQEIELKLQSPDGNDLTEHAQISWFDESGMLIGSGSKLPGQVEGYQVSYEIVPDEELGKTFYRPENGRWTISGKNNVITLKLKKLESSELKGTLTDAKDGKGVKNGFVTVAQIVNGNYNIINTVATNEKGEFTIGLYDFPGIITAGSNDYSEKEIEFSGLADASAKTKITVNPLTGTEINLSLMARENIIKGSTDNSFVNLDNYSNISFEVRNLTTGKDIEWRYRNPKLILIEEVNEGDKIEITAYPGESKFKATTETITISGDRGDVKFTFITDGDISASYKEANSDEVIGLLYDKTGNLQSKQSYSGKKALFKNIPSGQYTLITMMGSKLFSDAGSLAELESSALTPGKDYLMNEANVEEGYITPVGLSTVPAFLESLFYYTGAETSVSVNKKSVTVGATVTVRAKVDFLPEYSDKIEKLNIIFNIPEGCDYVENSLLVGGSGANFTTLSDGRLSVEMAVKDASPRFCIIPRKGGEYRPSAMIEFELDGRLISQPIGSAMITAGDFSLSVPGYTSVPTITARGVATPLSEVRIYDNDMYMGSARSLTNGEWRFKFNLFNPEETGKDHYIHGVIITPDGLKYNTVTAKTNYDVWTADLIDIEMIYGGSLIDFNHVTAETVPGVYTYNPGNDMFTFKAIFRDGHGEKVEDLDFIIILSDGSRHRIAAKYLLGTETWTCAVGFPNVNRLPVNVKVLYHEKRDSEKQPLIDDSDEPLRCPDVIPVIDPSGYVYEAVPSNRVEGVTSTIYYREWVEDMYGDVSAKAVKWDAAEFAQENPLFTDIEGRYQWDVPQGEWQVRFDKEGFEPAQTDWLPVPPPQLDVNVGISRLTPPVVKSAKAYPQSVEVYFDKYMDVYTLTARNISVNVGGNAVEGSIKLINEEKSGENSFASGFRFIASEPFKADNVQISISNRVKSYAGISMEESISQEFDVEPEITGLKAPAVINSYVGFEREFVVSLEPVEAAAGKTLLIELNTPIIKVNESATVDEKGNAIVKMTGDLPGMAYLNFTVEDTYLPKEYQTAVNVEVVSAQVPISSVQTETAVYRGETIELTTDHGQGKIYYTLDGSHPGEENSSRILYSKPIEIKEELSIKAINIVEGVADHTSEVGTFHYTLKNAELSIPLEKGWNWVSHNLEGRVALKDLQETDKVERILSKTQEAIKDPVYGLSGNLRELNNSEGYKINASESVILKGGKDIALNPTTPIQVLAGWSWISYPVERDMDINDALMTTAAEYEDMIVGKSGFSTFNGEKWIGQLTELEPKQGYMYLSGRVKEIQYNAFGQDTRNFGQTESPKKESHWQVDKSRYASVMPVIAILTDADGYLMDGNKYDVAAFCGEECRGIGSYIDGYTFLTVYGNPGDEIIFRMISDEEGDIFSAKNNVEFAEECLGTLSEPYMIGGTRSGIEVVESDDKITISVVNNILIISGGQVDSIAIYDLEGVKKYKDIAPSSNRIRLDFLSPGIYVINVAGKSNSYNQKIVIK